MDEHTQKQALDRVCNAKHVQVLAIVVCTDDERPVILKFDPPHGWTGKTMSELVRDLIRTKRFDPPLPGVEYPGRKSPPCWPVERLIQYCLNIIGRPKEKWSVTL